MGVTPYPTVPHERLFEVLREGHRMDQPYYSSVDLYTIMRQCWQYHPAQRPTFSEIMDDVDGILTKTPDVSLLPPVIELAMNLITTLHSSKMADMGGSNRVAALPAEVLHCELWLVFVSEGNFGG